MEHLYLPLHNRLSSKRDSILLICDLYKYESRVRQVLEAVHLAESRCMIQLLMSVPIPGCKSVTFAGLHDKHSTFYGGKAATTLTVCVPVCIRRAEVKPAKGSGRYQETFKTFWCADIQILELPRTGRIEMIHVMTTETS